MTIIANFNGSSSWIRGDSTSFISGTPFTYVAWFRLNTTGTNRCIMGISATNSTSRRQMVVTNTNILRFAAAANTSTTNTVSANTWHLGVAIMESTTSYTSVLNGDWASRGTATSSTSTFNFPFEIGAFRNNGSTSQFFDGSLWGETVYEVAFTQQDVEAMWNGRLHPRMFYPHKIIYHRESGSIDMVRRTGTVTTQDMTFSGEGGPPVRWM